MNKKLYRTGYNKMIAGVCNGLAEYFNADVSLVRIATVIALFAGLGLIIPIYFLMAIVLPLKRY
ncbi:MAG: PspC domain-containing protein [Bacilli bacterium]